MHKKHRVSQQTGTFTNFLLFEILWCFALVASGVLLTSSYGTYWSLLHEGLISTLLWEIVGMGTSTHQIHHFQFFLQQFGNSWKLPLPHLTFNKIRVCVSRFCEVPFDLTCKRKPRHVRHPPVCAERCTSHSVEKCQLLLNACAYYVNTSPMLRMN